jgi:hypothetical protein
MNHKGRKTNRASLEKMFTGKDKNSLVAIEMLLKIETQELKMERQSVYEYDDIYFVEEFYGEIGNLGVTVQYKKKQLAITGKYYMFIETDKERIEYKTRVASKAWSLCNKAERIKEDSIVASEEALDDILSQL